MKKYLSVFLSLVVTAGVFAGCNNNNGGRDDSNDSKNADSATTDNTSEMNESTASTEVSDSTEIAESTEAAKSTEVPEEADFSQTDADMISNRDRREEYDEDKSIQIKLNGKSASASSDSVKIEDSVITITEEAAYIISGTLDDGMIIVDAPDTAKLQLVFNGVEITSKTSAPLYILEADKVFVTLADGTENILSNGGTFTAIDENNIDAAVFSKQDLTFNGGGSLTVTSPAGHGIVCKDDLVFTNGTYTLNSSSHGMDVNDSVRIADETKLTIDAGKDGIHCENTDDASLGFVYVSDGEINIEAEGDGITAGAYVQIEDGKFDLLIGGGSENGTKASSGNYGGFMGGGRDGGMHGGGMRGGDNQNSAVTTTEETVSMKGIKAANSIQISGGMFNIDSADDSIHSDISVTIKGGEFNIASGDDAVHAEETLTVIAGNFDITECYEGLEALNIAVNGGDIRLTASDDGLNAAGGNDSSGTAGGRDGMFGGGKKGKMGGGMSPGNGSIIISDGNLYINSSGDGIDANGTVEISGGYTVVTGPTHGDTATLDYDRSAVITGGTFIGSGASGMAQTFSDSGQGVVAVSVGEQSAGTKISLTDMSGNIVIEHTPELNFSVVILSSPDISKGETYKITVGTQSGEFEAN